MNNIDTLHTVIAGNIRSERKKRHISQAVLAEKANISIDTVKMLKAEKGL